MNRKRDENSDIYPPASLARDGVSPYYIGKPKRKKLDSSARLKSTSPPPKLIMRDSTEEEDEQIVIEEDDHVDTTPVKEKNRKPLKNASLRSFLTVRRESSEYSDVQQHTATSGHVVAASVLSKTSQNYTEGDDFPPSRKNVAKKVFNFASDPNVSRIRDKICEIVDPTGEQRRNPEFLQRMAEKAQKSAEIVATEPHKKTKKTSKGSNCSTTSIYPSFTTANGQDVHKSKFVNPIDSEKRAKMVDLIRQPSPQNPNIPSIGSRKPSVPDLSKKSSFTGPAIVKKAMEMDNSGGGKDENLSGLRAEPSLKHFDENIISLIESEIMSINTEIGWNDVAGLDGAKKALREIVVLPFKRPDVFTGIRAPPKGVLLFGPPGTGKTMIGRCVASQCRATFFNISASSLTSKWVGEGEKLVRALFAVARLKLPSVIFIDEVDSLLSSRSESEHESSRRIKTEFLVQLDGVNTASDERLLVLGATNRPQELDEAARRRFQKRLYIALPESESRTKIVENLLRDTKNSIDSRCLEKISELTMGYSGADMRQLCTEAAMGPIRDVGDDIETIPKDDIRSVNLSDFIAATRVVRPTVDDSQLDAYSLWDRKFGCLPPQ
ncbi:unnamed protein product [Caenorhabditis angaria]|uniref:AAA+ ATPase domain-containing protein n=1 Tax=Caenorhabditis angaria TaxID=860376 RepID=A0A9P1IV47_9PELO|nr:unnamed protein product [Caenorhabditis angaria]